MDSFGAFHHDVITNLCLTKMCKEKVKH